MYIWLYIFFPLLALLVQAIFLPLHLFEILICLKKIFYGINFNIIIVK